MKCASNKTGEGIATILKKQMLATTIFKVVQTVSQNGPNITRLLNKATSCISSGSVGDVLKTIAGVTSITNCVLSKRVGIDSTISNVLLDLRDSQAYIDLMVRLLASNDLESSLGPIADSMLSNIVNAAAKILSGNTITSVDNLIVSSQTCIPSNININILPDLVRLNACLNKIVV